MYSPFKGGIFEDICGLKINIPPVGYVPDYWGGTGELVKVPILLKKENKWTRIVPQHIQDEIERLHFDPKEEPDMDVEGLQDFVETEWQRRYNGIWFYNNGKPTYITGLHYFYLMWWQMDTGYPNFREFDRKTWYFWQYCCEDETCLGMIEISKRKIGKCFAKDTLVRMYDGSVKEIQDIKEGELVMGDDFTPRTVDGVTSGKETMFDVVTKNGDRFTCNESHILYLKEIAIPEKIKITVKEYNELPQEKKDRLYLLRRDIEKHKNTGWHWTDKFTVTQSVEQDYYGFSLDGNNLFLLENGIVVHNTYKGAASVFEHISRSQRVKGGIVSKTTDDARDTAYTECLVFPYTNQPFFFKPVVDNQSGTLFKSGMRFVATSRKNKGKFEQSLASSITYSDADINGYNGPKLARYLADEAAKVVICDVYQRHNIARECCMTDGKVIGKMYYTTTIEDLERGGRNFLKLVKDSNQNKRLPNGQTSTKLYTFFLPVTHAYNFDEYGFPRVEENRKEIIENIQGLEGNPTAQAAYRRMNALSMSDLFSAESDGCPFHITNLTYAENAVLDSPEPTTVIGNFIETGGKVEFMENPNGKWEFSTLKFQQYANKRGHPHSAILPPDVSYQDCRSFPANTHQFGIGVDPVDSGDWAKYGKSCFAISVYYNYDPANLAESDDFVGDYIFDPNNPEDSYKDVMLCCLFFSAPAFIETNKATDLISYFKRNGMSAFIMNKPEILAGKLQNSYDPGASATNKMIDLYINRLQTYTTLRVWRKEENTGCKLLRTIRQLKEFTRDTRGEKDLAVAAGYAKVAAEANITEVQIGGNSYYTDRLLESYGVGRR